MLFVARDKCDIALTNPNHFRTLTAEGSHTVIPAQNHPDEGIQEVLMIEESKTTDTFWEIIDRDLPFLRRYGRLLHLSRGDQLLDLTGQPDHLYLVESAVVSLGAGLVDGRSAEVALLGRGALLGMCSAHAWGMMPYRATVQRSGDIWQFNVAGMQRTLLQSPMLGQYMRHALETIFVQITQSAVCNRHHHIEQQVAKVLLQFHDLTALQEIFLTQQDLSDLLGVRREGITRAIGKLQLLGSIGTRRGRVRILRRSLLEQQSCECYQHISRTQLTPVLSCQPVPPNRVSTQRRFSATNTAAERAKTPEITAALLSAPA